MNTIFSNEQNNIIIAQGSFIDDTQFLTTSINDWQDKETCIEEMQNLYSKKVLSLAISNLDKKRLT